MHNLIISIVFASLLIIIGGACSPDSNRDENAAPGLLDEKAVDRAGKTLEVPLTKDEDVVEESTEEDQEPVEDEAQ